MILLLSHFCHPLQGSLTLIGVSSKLKGLKHEHSWIAMIFGHDQLNFISKVSFLNFEELMRQSCVIT